jgi:hypothetical protein
MALPLACRPIRKRERSAYCAPSSIQPMFDNWLDIDDRRAIDCFETLYLQQAVSM